MITPLADCVVGLAPAEVPDRGPAILERSLAAAKTGALPRHCRRCRYLRYCDGGCPVHRRRRTPGGEPGLNHLCEGYRMLFRHTLGPFRAMARVSRGAPCPCGTGRKHEPCCGAGDAGGRG